MFLCIALINLVVAQIRSAQHKTFFRILNIWVEISSPRSTQGLGCGYSCLVRTELLDPLSRLGLLVVCLFFFVNNL